MIQYFITIIIIIIFIEIYIRYYIKQVTDIHDIHDIHEPWDKIDIGVDKNKYYIKISNFDEYKFIEWKKLPIKIDYDINNNYLIIKTKSEDTALSIANLFISNMNNELELQSIIDNNLINISKLKAKTHKLVRIKLIELIKQGKNKYFDVDTRLNTGMHFDTHLYKYVDINKHIDSPEHFNINTIIKQEPVISIQNDINEHILYDEPLDKIEIKLNTPSSMFAAYGGSEYATISFG